MLHGFASPVQKTDSFLQPAIFDPINIRLPAFKQIAENSGLVYLSRRTLYRGLVSEAQVHRRRAVIMKKPNYTQPVPLGVGVSTAFFRVCVGGTIQKFKSR